MSRAIDQRRESLAWLGMLCLGDDDSRLKSEKERKKERNLRQKQRKQEEQTLIKEDCDVKETSITITITIRKDESRH